MVSRPVINRFFGLLAALLLSFGPQISLAPAATEVVPLETLHVHDVIYLPTVRSAYETTFTRPKTWKLAPSSNVTLVFQHSHALLPNRSWLEVSINGKTIKHLPLTHENENATTIAIPIPVAYLKDYNTLTFRVEQHYTDHCEDPLDKSLWTQVLPDTKLVFNYTSVLPQVDLAAYPYPIVDPLTYSPTRVRYVVPAGRTRKLLQALGNVNVNLSQASGKKELLARVGQTDAGAAADEHLVYLGTPSQNPAMAGLAVGSGYRVSGGRWVTDQGQPLNDDEGLLLFVPHPAKKNLAVLIVSGNTEDGVLYASKYLTTNPRAEALLGHAAIVPANWTPSGTRSAKKPRFLENETRTFAELGYGVQAVEKINAPPITYHIPIVGNFRQDGARLFLDVNYSYSPELNPTFSSLELRLNDRSIANIPLMNVQGEENKQASIPIAKELIQPKNDLVAQFHLLPDKFGRCKDNYEDKAWGKILDTSRLRVEGPVGSLLPDAGLLNETGFPYTRQDNLESMHVVLPEQPSDNTLLAFLGFTTRLGRATLADTDLRFTLSTGNESLPAGKDLVVFRAPSDNISLAEGYRLAWTQDASISGLLRAFHLAPGNDKALSLKLADNGQGTYIEQYQARNNQIVTVVTAEKPNGFVLLSQLFETDKLFNLLEAGPLQLLAPDRTGFNATTAPDIYAEDQSVVKGGNWWDALLHLPWLNIALIALGVLLVVVLLPAILWRIRRRL